MKRVTISVKWKEIKDFPNYKISNNGLVIKDGVLQNVFVETLGRSSNLKYKYINLKQKGLEHKFGKKYFIHRLVWIHFGTNEDYNPLVIDHINNDSLDNRIENLQLITNYENLLKGRLKKGEISTDRYNFLVNKKKQQH